MITIALDAMGGDNAPRAEIEGALLAVREFDIRIVLVGVEATVRQELARQKPKAAAAARIDFLISSANKCIEGVPGFGFVLARRLIVLSFQRVYQRCAGLRTQREALPAAGSRCSGA